MIKDIEDKDIETLKRIISLSKKVYFMILCRLVLIV